MVRPGLGIQQALQPKKMVSILAHCPHYPHYPSRFLWAGFGQADSDAGVFPCVVGFAAGGVVVGGSGFDVKSTNEAGNGTPGLADENEASTEAKEAADNDDAICCGVRLVTGSASDVSSEDVDVCSFGGCDCVVIVVFAKT